MTQDIGANQDSSGFAAGLMLGLIIGGAGGYYLSTSEGREILEKLKGEAGEKVKEILDNPNVSGKLADLEATMQQAREVVNQAATKVKDATAKEAPKKNFFQRAGLSLGK